LTKLAENCHYPVAESTTTGSFADRDTIDSRKDWSHFPNRLCNPISAGLWNRPSLPELRAKSTTPIEISYPTAIWDENS
jgi:hypothetical protein